MDIIVHGEYKRPKYRIKCHNCGCIFECSEYELHSFAGITEKIYVDCPECKRWNNLNKNGIKRPV